MNRYMSFENGKHAIVDKLFGQPSYVNKSCSFLSNTKTDSSKITYLRIHAALLSRYSLQKNSLKNDSIVIFSRKKKRTFIYRPQRTLNEFNSLVYNTYVHLLIIEHIMICCLLLKQ